MDVELHARPPDAALPAAVASRKRNGTDSYTDSDDTINHYVSSEDSGNDCFELLRSRKSSPIQSSNRVRPPVAKGEKRPSRDKDSFVFALALAAEIGGGGGSAVGLSSD
ncbi:hypothetical protein HPB50_019737 [Hyalomma asiaticum]|uniref:Uncharacterized protein n=1 Tax=Hyalomma asiaticum TaxID=266040 RepID=A0ACB7TN27_HYAAI|nr:hypothetical protein HPB50_019737 [Hyalomma asiaticum]